MHHYIFYRTAHNPYENEIFRDSEDELINLLVLGKDGLGEELEEKIKVCSETDVVPFLICCKDQGNDRRLNLLLSLNVSKRNTN